MYDLPNNAIIYADSARGVYIPQFFAESIRRDLVQGVSNDDWRILEAGPESEWHWETWESVLNNATIHHAGIDYVLWQDGDLWLVPADWQPSEDSF